MVLSTLLNDRKRMVLSTPLNDHKGFHKNFSVCEDSRTQMLSDISYDLRNLRNPIPVSVITEIT